MTNTASKLKRVLCGMVVMLALLAGITSVPVLAASPGIYTATAASHYKHPTTGVIEDSGGEGSYVLGQSMTDSALNKAALVEVDPQGNTYVTIRLNLMDNIQSPQFQVDGSRSGSFSAVSAAVMQEDYSNNTADFRMQVPSENAIIRCNMYVVPMGRDVIFYITVGGLSAGSGDFVTSITVEEPVAEPEPAAEPEPEPVTEPEPVIEPEPEPATEPEPVTEPEVTEPPASEEPTISAAEEPTAEEPLSEPENENAASKDEEEGSAFGLAEFDASGNKVSNTSTEAEQGVSTGNPVIWWVIGGIVAAAIAGGCVWYFCFFRRGKSPFHFRRDKNPFQKK